MAVSSKKFQAPKGMRDFYPQDMAVRRYIENIWRTVSINHGFDEVDGPTFEHLDLYTHKSGPGIVSEIFQVFSGKDEAERAAVQRTAQAPFALRPEFTPTLARMVAAQADSLPKPIKWFAIPTMFRAERPQRGRLREHVQWNVDFIGVPSEGMFRAQADVAMLALMVAAFERFGLSARDVRVKLGDREAVRRRLKLEGRDQAALDDDLTLLDERPKLRPDEYRSRTRQLGWKDALVRLYDPETRLVVRLDDMSSLPDRERQDSEDQRKQAGSLLYEIDQAEIAEWCEFDSLIVRGLAYYTGLVFEAHEATGAHRAIAGGGRYDNLIESFGGPSLPACGFGMGDVVLGNILHDKGLLPEDVYMAPLRPHAFVVAADDQAAAQLPKIVADLRKQGFHVRHSYKTTRNVGKLLGEAGKSRACFAIILGKELAENKAVVKNLESGEQGDPIPLMALVEFLRAQSRRV
ncbi:MAG: histidine--tRNA ligase [Phycisphaerales bacterium]|nr:histidine--tRNA ligase [Phycisphaerales bacterium]